MRAAYWRNAMVAAAVAWACAPAVAQDIVEVTVTGEGMTEDGARNDALRRALEQGGRVEISSHSQVENFQLIRDTIYARAEGIVSDYQIIDKGAGAGGVKYCKIKAKVNKSAIATSWGEVQNVLDQIGRPGVAIYIKERIDGVIQDSSILESQLENKLLAAGFKVYAGQQLRSIAEKESADAAAEDNIAKVQAIAKDYGTQIFITGTAQANSAGTSEVAGTKLTMYNGDAAIKMFYTDTAELLASESLGNWRGGARGFHTISPQAGKKALENAGQELIERCYKSVMEHWARQISTGSEITLEIEGVRFADMLRIKKAIKAIDPDLIKKVNSSLTKGIATIRIKAKMTGEELAGILGEEPFASMFEIVDAKTNRIQAKKIGK